MGWNAVWIVVGLSLIAVAGEAWLRSTTPFRTSDRPTRFVPGVGLLREPHAQIRHTNHLDFWTTARANRLGFLDREPPDAERAAASCHIAIIGDSYVEAQQVPIADKAQVRLEELAARRAPELDVTTSAYGHGGTGQVNQLPYYDEYARRLRPKLVVLVFGVNDYLDNFGMLRARLRGLHPERYPMASAIRNRQGTIELRPPSADWRTPPRPIRPRQLRWVLPLGRFGFPRDLYAGDTLNSLLNRAATVSYFATWLGARGFRSWMRIAGRFERVSGGYDDLPDDWSWMDDIHPAHPAHRMFRQAELPRFLERSLDYTAFGLEQFKRRAERDGFRLAVLSVHTAGAEGDPQFDRMHGMAEARGIPVIDQYDYIVRQGARVEEANWRRDHHWNAAGHRWAAEALLEWLERNRDVCRPGGGAPLGGFDA